MTSEPKLFLGNKEYVVLPMNLKTVIAITPLLKSLEKITAKAELPEQCELQDVVKIIFLALKRGNPDITQDELEENLDMRNMFIALQTIMSASGAVQTGEAKAGSL